MKALISPFLIGVTPASLLVGRPVPKGKNRLGILTLAPNSLTLRRRLSIELVLLGVCATGFLLVFPERPWGVDVGLAFWHSVSSVSMRNSPAGWSGASLHRATAT
jgi:hypothetical protein